MSKRYSIPRSFKFAANGFKIAFDKEPNFRTHSITTLVVLVAAYFFNFSTTEYAILILTIGIVLTLELINTAMEAIVNLVSPEIKDMAKVAKDVSAASVLLAATIAVLVGIFLFLPKIILILT